ncbi:MAG: hypothetical protein A2Y93_18060 [Chloroflexi bacterium RBG_13_68_17]|nr:MAG: hypothetical protein A2Y93_18060 [Chloroflexi bacterium RBG_13_68_17]
MALPRPRSRPRFHRMASLVAVAALVAGACANAPGGSQAVRFTETAPAATPMAPAPSLPARTPTPDCVEPVGWVEALTYPGVVVREPIPLRVYLPPCYDNSDTRFPVAYLLHGKPYDETHWEDLGVSVIADQGIASGEWPPFLLVMPLQPEPIFSNSDGGRWSYEEEMVEGLVPFIDDTYRTDARPEARALAGISRGGVWALEIGFRNPTLFGAVGALSPALAVNHPRPAYDPFQIVLEASSLPPRIFLAAGDSDWARPATERLGQVLAEDGWVHTLVILPGSHEDGTWQSTLRPLLAFFAAAWESVDTGIGPPRPTIP